MVKCKYCGKETKNLKFCSRSCANKSNKNKPWLGTKRPGIGGVKKGTIPWNKGKKGLCKPNVGSFKKGNKPGNWKGGMKTYFQNQAREVMENKIRRKLKSKETVHHLDFNKKNNHPSNLYLFENRNQHMKYHLFLRRIVINFLGLKKKWVIG